MSTNNTQDEHATFAALLQAAIDEPGTIHEAFHAFHSYSVGNQILAFIQCQQRGIQPASAGRNAGVTFAKARRRSSW